MMCCRHSPYHRRLFAAAAGGCGYRFGSSAFNVARTVKSMIKAGRQDCILKIRLVRNAAVIVRISDRLERGDGGSDPRGGGCETDPDFVIMARTDALAVEGLDRRSSVRRPMLKRVPRCCSRSDYRTRHVPPVCRCGAGANPPNITEFGATPLFTTDELRSAMSQWRCTRFQRSAP